MITLKHVTINKYKSIETVQSFPVEPDITVLVGKNESGKTAILESVAKSNPYLDEHFDITLDFPRKELKKFERSDHDIRVVECTYELSAKLVKTIEKYIGPETLGSSQIIHSRWYSAERAEFETLDINTKAFFDFMFDVHDIRNKGFKKKVTEYTRVEELQRLSGRYSAGKTEAFLESILAYLQSGQDIKQSLSRYILKKWIQPNLPRFLYYDEYYALPSEVDLTQLQGNALSSAELKTSKALFDQAQIDLKALLQDSDYEKYKAELEATSIEISTILFEYWTTNRNLRVQFDIRNEPAYGNRPVLKIRVFNDKYHMSLPLGSRSRGFNWFFSFLIWFSQIQEDRNNRYILLLDEPGLNLHASAQKDLLRFLDHLSETYQLIYTTHSPFMVHSDKLHRVRTVLESETGTRISESLDEDDKDTLFPLQAALGYNIAQNLFVGENNLIVEGISDILYLRVMSAILKDAGRTGLQSDIVVVPVGGFGKVATFVSLLHGNELNMACLLDRVAGSGGEQEVNKLIKKKLIRAGNVMYFNAFAANGGKNADVEDMFAKSEYLNLFNETFDDIPNVKIEQLDQHEKRIVKQIQKHIGKDFNHYRPAYTLSAKGVDDTFFGKDTLNRFEKMFQEINKLFER